MSTARLETFCDGVFAIAITLLVLIFVEPTEFEGSLARALVDQWPSYLAYVISFATIGIIWVNHHEVMRHVALTDRTFLFINVFFLMTIAFLPYPTRVVASNLNTEGERAAVIFYGLSNVAMALGFLVLWLYPSRGHRLLREDADPRAISGITRSYLPGVPMYLAATLVAFVSPTVSLVCFGALALFYVLESSVFARA
jgi:uncharacterized membrane protein